MKAIKSLSLLLVAATIALSVSAQPTGSTGAKAATGKKTTSAKSSTGAKAASGKTASTGSKSSAK